MHTDATRRERVAASAIQSTSRVVLRRAARALAAGDEQRVDRPVDLDRGARPARTTRWRWRAARVSGGRDDHLVAGRLEQARGPEHLGRPGHVQRLNAREGDDDDATHWDTTPSSPLDDRGRKDHLPDDFCHDSSPLPVRGPLGHAARPTGPLRSA